jgi:hypothetical protein
MNNIKAGIANRDNGINGMLASPARMTGTDKGIPSRARILISANFVESKKSPI